MVLVRREVREAIEEANIVVSSVASTVNANLVDDEVGVAKDATVQGVLSELTGWKLRLVARQSGTLLDNSAGTSSATYTLTATVDATGLLIILLNLSISATVSLSVNGVSGVVNGGNALTAGAWYEFELPVASGDTIALSVEVPAGAVLSGYVALFIKRL